MTPLSFFIYARKSTDDTERQVMSIDRQLFDLRQLAEREGLRIVEELIETRTARKPGRPIFNAMLRRIARGEATGILTWHPDRLARNGIDGGQITHALDSGALATLKFASFWFENTPQGKFMLNMAFSQSQYYVHALSVNTISGLDEKVRRGEYPGHAPFGYLNDRRIKRIAVDRERAPVIREAFERYATGQNDLDDLRQFFADKGYRSRNGKLIGSSVVSALLSNPIYYGHFRYRGEIHEGCHEPIITKALFDAVQAVFARRWRTSPALSREKPKKAFTGLLRCGYCGSAITAEVQKGHTYYRCTRKNKAKPCSEPFVREEALEKELSSLLLPYALPTEFADPIQSKLKEYRRKAAHSTAAQLSGKRAEIAKIEISLDSLLSAYLDGIVNRAEYCSKKAGLLGTKKDLEDQISALSKGDKSWLEPLENFISTADSIGKIALSGSNPTSPTGVKIRLFSGVRGAEVSDWLRSNCRKGV